jgi:hypothetical protein
MIFESQYNIEPAAQYIQYIYDLISVDNLTGNVHIYEFWRNSIVFRIYNAMTHTA